MMGEVSWDPKEDDRGPLGIQSSLGKAYPDLPTLHGSAHAYSQKEMCVWGGGALKVHKIEIFLASILKFVIFLC